MGPTRGPAQRLATLVLLVPAVSAARLLTSELPVLLELPAPSVPEVLMVPGALTYRTYSVVAVPSIMGSKSAVTSVFPESRKPTCEVVTTAMELPQPGR